MEKQISSGLKNLFLAHFIIGLVFGLIYLVIPVIYGRMINWPVEDPTIYRLLGAAILGFSVSSFLAVKKKEWRRVEITVISEIFWAAIASLVMLWGMLVAGLPLIGWMNTVIMIFFAVFFTLFYFKEKE